MSTHALWQRSKSKEPSKWGHTVEPPVAREQDKTSSRPMNGDQRDDRRSLLNCIGSDSPGGTSTRTTTRRVLCHLIRDASAVGGIGRCLRASIHRCIGLSHDGRPQLVSSVVLQQLAYSR